MAGKQTIISGVVLADSMEYSLADLCRACSIHAEQLIELVDEGILEPRGRSQKNWRFSGVALVRARTALRLQRDLGVNLAGAALALQLLDEIDQLRNRVYGLQRGDRE